MIPAPVPHGHEALFLIPNGDDPEGTAVPVVAWSDDGRPLVVHDDRLKPADQVDGYAGTRAELPPMLAAIPGDGWQIEATTADGTTWTAPVIAWHVRPWPLATPIVVAPDGAMGYPQELSVSWRVWHPDGKTAPAA